jgi:hypothetical protein
MGNVAHTLHLDQVEQQYKYSPRPFKVDEIYRQNKRVRTKISTVGRPDPLISIVWSHKYLRLKLRLKKMEYSHKETVTGVCIGQVRLDHLCRLLLLLYYHSTQVLEKEIRLIFF